MAATDFRDYYATLGVNKTASADDIKQAFRRLARKYHPDVNPGDQAAEASFKEINEAYEVLSDTDKRRKYDQFGQYWKQAGTGWPGGGSGGGPDPSGFDFSQYGSFDEFINELLGRFGTGGPGGQRSAYSYRANPTSPPGGFGNDFSSGFRGDPTAMGQDMESNLSLTLGEAFNGTQKRLNLGNETVTVKIPPGAKAGSRIRLRGKGQINPYSQLRGDLYLVVSLQPHPFFQFEGDNLVCEVPIAPDEAVLGGAVDVPTPDGSVTMNVPAGIRAGQTLRLRGKGWPKKEGRGDQLVRVVIVPPTQISAVERDCYEKLRANRSTDPRQHLKTIKL